MQVYDFTEMLNSSELDKILFFTHQQYCQMLNSSIQLEISASSACQRFQCNLHKIMNINTSS